MHRDPENSKVLLQILQRKMVTLKEKQNGNPVTREKSNHDEFPVNEVQIMTLDFMLYVSGLLPPNNATPFIRLLNKMFLTCIFALYAYTLLGELIAVFLHWGDIPVISTIMSYMSALLIAVIDSIYFLHNKDKFMRLIDLLRTEFVANMNSKYIKFVHSAEREVKQFLIIAFPFATVLGTISVVLPFLNDSTISNFDNNTVTTEGSNFKKLTVVMWLPFSVEDSPQFEIILGLQMMVIWCSILMLTAVDLIFLLLLSHAAAQFKVLCAMLNDMHENVSEVEMNRTKHKSPLQDPADFNFMKDPVTSADDITCHDSGSENCGSPSFETCPESRHVNRDAFRLYLVKCIKYHQAVIEYVDNLNDIVSLVTSVKIVNFPLILCMTGFEMTQSLANHEQFLQFTSFLAASLVLIAIYSWFGQRVIDESEKVQLAFYNTDWYSQTPGYKSLLPLAIQTASRPVQVRAGVLFDMSFLTLASLVNASYRYFTMLIQLHDS